MKKTYTLLLLIFTCIQLFSQIGGNQLYRKDRNYDKTTPVTNFESTDSTVVFQAKVLLNQPADHYMLTLGVSQEGKSPAECLTKINQRIANFTTKIQSIGLKKQDIFVDFISQTKFFDFDVKSEDEIRQVEKGFIVKKNIILKIDKYEDIEKAIVEAAGEQIYDIVKVDYLNDNIDQIYTRLLNEANQLLEKKKNEYLRLFKRQIIGQPHAEDRFSYVFPKSQYEEYAAFESSDVENYSSSVVKKLARKSRTYYYEGENYSGYDRVINNANPTVGIQYILHLTVSYDVEKSKKR